MAIVRWKNSDLYDPWETMRRLQDEINQFFDVDRLPAGTGLFDRSMSPAVDVIEGQDKFSVICELPGMEKDDIELSLTPQILTIKGHWQNTVDSGEKERKYYRQETRKGNFQRTVSLPPTADSEQVKAELKHGILTIVFPKKKEAIPKQISVKVH